MSAAWRARRILTASKNYLLIGQCVPTVKQNAIKIKIKRLELDETLLMFFKKDSFLYAHDPDKKCKHGDIVIVQELKDKLTTLITHKILEIVFPYGDVTDPITGKKCVIGAYRDLINMEVDMYGRLDSTFDYEKAPPRGWQEGKKDFTDKKTYIKYHQFPEDDPYAV